MTTICVNTLFLLREPGILETAVFVLHVVNPVGKEPRMKFSEFEQWCDRLQLPMSTRDFLLGLRSSPPARRVQGRLLNVSGTYASRKMGTLIQMETSLFLHLVDTQAITVPEFFLSPAATLSTEVHHLLTQAGPEALDIANQRYRLVEAYRNKQKDSYKGTPSRTIRDWQASFRDAEVPHWMEQGTAWGLVQKKE
jgi:hypothetical protein